jgi:hypothetical protein
MFVSMSMFMSMFMSLFLVRRGERSLRLAYRRLGLIGWGLGRQSLVFLSIHVLGNCTVDGRGGSCGYVGYLIGMKHWS